MAPLAAQRAAFEEDGRADAWTIVEGEFLDIENRTGKLVHITQAKSGL